MKGWKIVKPFALEQCEIAESVEQSASLSKVKITKALITLEDVLRFRGEGSYKNVVPCKSGIGIISETDANLFDLEKGKHTYIDPYRACSECYNCKNGNYERCLDVKVAGEDFHGFLSDFTSVATNKLFTLPTSVSDFDALFIQHVSLALSLFDKLDIQKGDYVAVIGGNNFANIFAQLLIYYQAVPILLSPDEEDCEIAKASGIYYVLGNKDNWQKEVTAITSGRMTNKIAFISESDVPISKALLLASNNAVMAFTGVSCKTATFPYAQAVKKQISMLFVNNGSGQAAAAINLIANKAINLSHLKLDVASYDKIPEVFEKMSSILDTKGKVYETVVDMI